MTNEEMAAALRAAGYRVEGPIDQKTCPHPPEMVTGHGMIGSDGSGYSGGHCRRCGHSWHHEWKGTAVAQPWPLLMNGKLWPVPGAVAMVPAPNAAAPAVGGFVLSGTDRHTSCGSGCPH